MLWCVEAKLLPDKAALTHALAMSCERTSSWPTPQLPGARLVQAQEQPDPRIIIQPVGTAGHSAVRVHRLVLGEGALPAVVAALQTACQPSIVEAQVANCQLSPSCWPPSSNLAHVTSLTLTNCCLAGLPTGSLAGVLAQGLQHMSGLRKLCVTGCCLPQPLATLSSLTGLQVLSLDECEVDSMPSLTSLTGRSAGQTSLAAAG